MVAQPRLRGSKWRNAVWLDASAHRSAGRAIHVTPPSHATSLITGQSHTCKRTMIAIIQRLRFQRSKEKLPSTGKGLAESQTQFPRDVGVLSPREQQSENREGISKNR